MSIADIGALLLGESLEQTLSNIVAFLTIIQLIGLLFIFIANLTGVNRR